MQIPFRQNTPSGCGYYCLANFFNNASYIEGVESLTKGQHDEDLNERMRKYDPDFYLSSIFVTQLSFTKQSNRLVDDMVFGMQYDKMDDDIRKNYLRPFIVTVKNIVHFHSVLLVHDFQDHAFYLFDSKNDKPITYTNINDFINDRPITEVKLFASRQIKDTTGDQSIFIHRDFLSHLLLPTLLSLPPSS